LGYLLFSRPESGLKPGPVALAGELVCLPTESGEESEPCVIGLESGGKVYGLGGISPNGLQALEAKKGERVEVSGNLGESSPELKSGYGVDIVISVDSVMQGGVAVVSIEDLGTAGLATYPDLALTSVPTEPVTAKFVVEHRSALSGKPITVKGMVTEAILGEKACPPDLGACAAPRIFIADSLDVSRDKNYDLMILVDESASEKDYPIGKAIEISGTVEASKVAVNLRSI